MKYIHYYIAILIGALLSSCGSSNSPSPQTSQETSPETAQETAAVFDLNEAAGIIQKKTNKFTAAHITKDTAYLNNSFTKDARVFPPNAEAVVGRSDIAQLNVDWVNYGVYEFTEKSTALYGNQEYLIDEGTYYLRYGDENTIDQGKYINIWTQENGDWKICSNIWNSNLPL
ncbi:MAG: DUF4440 domain-containing protein [Bacteroidetes bacterium]|nr:DUF4440 domain-containing protein [Bacteroidota bacterium]